MYDYAFNFDAALKCKNIYENSSIGSANAIINLYSSN